MTTHTTQTEELFAGLRRPDAYPFPVDRVEHLETHASRLFFAGDRVYKTKKPVNLGFLDFTSFDQRRHFCDEEVRLNRQLAPGVYLGVVPITEGANGRLRVGGSGRTVDWAVEMRRLPAERMLARRLERGEIDNEQIEALARLIADFHAGAATGPGVDDFGHPDAVAKNVGENFDQLRSFVGSSDSTLSASLAATLEATADEFLETRRPRFLRRVTEGHVREGHGDLHAENICWLREGPIAYDRIEFSSRFRCADVACDLAFLAMDLDYRGFAAFSRYLVRRYSEITEDRELIELIDFYKTYRAVVRGKVASLRSLGEEGDARLASRLEAMRYFHLAAAYDLPPALVLMCGLPGSGKSWLAREIANPFQAVVIRSDVRRKRLAGVRIDDRRGDAIEGGSYTPDMTARTYRSMLDSEVDSLLAGRTVVIDATFSTRAHRTPFVDAAARLGHPFYVVHVVAPPDLIRSRLEHRARDSREASDADVEVYERLRGDFEPPTEIGPEHLLEVQSGEQPAEQMTGRLIDLMLDRSR